MRRSFAFAAFSLFGLSSAAPAFAQAPPLSPSVTIGGWAFRPLIEVRVRGEYRKNPVDVGGDVFTSTAVLSERDAATGAVPVAYAIDPIEEEWGIGGRARLGLAVDRGPVTAALTLQDARAWGATNGLLVRAPGKPSLPSFGPYEAYIDLHAARRRTFVRVGRQSVVWGEGRLVGASDWSATPRSLDAVRAGVSAGDFDFELLSAMLAAPGETFGAAGGLSATTGSAGSALATDDSTTVGVPREVATHGGIGAELHGLRAVWHALPLLQIELMGLARIVRDPAPAWLTPGDTFVADARAAGERRGFRYAIEGAYEGGRIATVGASRSLSALAAAGRAELETALPWHLTFGAQAAYASGDKGPLDATGTQQRFDPIFPDEHANHGLMGLYAWSNLREIGGDVAARPTDAIDARIAYRYAALAESRGRWITAELIPVGSAKDNTETALGHEIEATLGFTPAGPIRIEAGYGLFLFGDGANAVLDLAGRGTPGAQHWAFLQTTVHAP